MLRFGNIRLQREGDDFLLQLGSTFLHIAPADQEFKECRIPFRVFNPLLVPVAPGDTPGIVVRQGSGWSTRDS